MTPTQKFIAAIEAKGRKVRRIGTSKAEAQCPAHDDRAASLSIAEGDDGRVLLHCHRGCEPADIVASLTMEMSDLFPQKNDPSPRRNGSNGTAPKMSKVWTSIEAAIEATRRSVAKRTENELSGVVYAAHWLYRGVDGADVAAVVRFDLPTPAGEKREKTFRPLHKVPGGWAMGDPVGLWPLYGLAAIEGAARVWVCEGEKSADAAAACGLVVTTAAHGAQAPGKTDWAAMKGAEEIIIAPDNDDAGEDFANKVTSQVFAVNPTATIKIVRLAELAGEGFPKGGDFVDFVSDFRDGQSDEDIRAEVEGAAHRATVVAPETAEPVVTADAEDPEATFLVPINFADLAAERPERGPEVVGGILREGAIAAMVSGTKCRKTFIVMALAAAGMSGGRVKWLGRDVAAGRVLIIDGELTPAAIHFRLRKVCEALGVGDEAFANLDVFSLRGRTKDAPRAMAYARSKPPGYYKIIIIDPQYVFYPNDPHFSENDNAAMRRFFDTLIQFAGETRAGVVVIHHASKGAQNEKSIADVGAGAGSISRSVDAHLILRPHVEADCVVFDGVVRDFPELSPTCWRWSFPTFTDALELDPTELAGGRKRRSTTAEFLAGGKPEKVTWTAATFAKKFITDEGRTLARLQAEGEMEGVAERRAKALTEQAVSLGWRTFGRAKLGRVDGQRGTPISLAQ